MGLKTNVNFTWLLFVLWATHGSAQTEGPINDVTSQFEQTKVISQSLPIMQYRQPTIGDLKACEAERDICVKNCTDVDNNDECLSKCPTCPIIIAQDHVIQGINDTGLSMASNPNVQHNLTTVIRLKNVIHNLVDMSSAPNVNATNLNEVNVYRNETAKSGGKFGFGYDTEGSCCLAVQPRSCHMSWNGPSCHHRRHRTCGQHCTSRIIHAQTFRSCKTKATCENRVRYVPQPKRQPCMYTNSWPYVSCGGQNKQRCEGCYDHYDQAEGDQITIPKRCLSCYENGFDMGQMYRRGPVFQPFYQHQLPCYLTGSCGGYMPYGYNGPQMMPPGWGYPQTEFFEGDGEQIEGDETSFNPAEWTVEAKKCKVTKEDGTVEITDCKDDTIADNFPEMYPVNPYAMDDGNQKENKRYRRYFRDPTRRRRHHKSTKAAVEMIKDE